MTSIEIPYSVACALPTLAVLDVTNEIGREVAASGLSAGIAFVTPVAPMWVARVAERESGFFCDVEDLLTRLVPLEAEERARLLLMLLGPRSEQIPFSDGTLCLGQWQRVLLVGVDGDARVDWTTTVVG